MYPRRKEEDVLSQGVSKDLKTLTKFVQKEGGDLVFSYDKEEHQWTTTLEYGYDQDDPGKIGSARSISHSLADCLMDLVKYVEPADTQN